MMKIKPVIHSAKPKYPDKYEIELNKTLLYYQPKRWLKEPLIGLTLSALLATGLTGCRDFRIGNGFGATAGAPPPPEIYHISEMDALSIIADELKDTGYTLVKDFDEDSGEGSFRFDALIVNSDNKIFLEYVTEQDLMNKKYPGLESLSNGYGVRYVAEELKGIHKDAAIFYDPASEYPYEELHEQVLDFIEWLKAVSDNL